MYDLQTSLFLVVTRTNDRARRVCFCFSCSKSSRSRRITIRHSRFFHSPVHFYPLPLSPAFVLSMSIEYFYYQIKFQNSIPAEQILTYTIHVRSFGHKDK